MPAAGYLAYTDGACIHNPGCGGWGAAIIAPDGALRELSGGPVPRTTNQRMEVTAAIRALREIPEGSQVVLRSDSAYLVRTMNDGWKRRTNLDLWAELDAEAARRRVKFEWVRGHFGDPMNERVDRLANGAAKGKCPPNETDAASESALSSRRRGPRPPQGTVARLALGAGERIAVCAGCRREFVTCAPAASREFCALVECQLKARAGG